jgi:hypothetical protein
MHGRHNMKRGFSVVVNSMPPVAVSAKARKSLLVRRIINNNQRQLREASGATRERTMRVEKLEGL